MNQVSLLGRIGGDLELKHTQSGSAVMNFTLATDEKTKRGDQWEKVTTWHRIVAWGKTAENIHKYFGKGSKIAVEGKLQNSEYEKQGVKVTQTKVNISKFHFCESGKAAPQQPQKPAPQQQFEDEDIPF